MPKESPEIHLAGIKLSKRSKEPLYLQLYHQIRTMIIEGRLRSGDRLPASRTLATELGASRVIVSQAYEQLIIEGYLSGKTGAGTFVADTLPDQLLHVRAIQTIPKKKATAEVNKPVVSLPQSEMQTKIEPFQLGIPSLDLFPYKIWQATGNKALKDLKTHNLGYGDSLGYWPLRKAIASYLRLSRAVQCEADQVVIVTGAQQGMNMVAGFLLKKGDKVWIEDPGYFGAVSSFLYTGVELCPVPVKQEGIDVDFAKRNFPDARLAYVTPSHQFPLGCMLPQHKRMELLQWAEENNAWILEDDYDSEYRYESRPLPSLQGMDKAGRVIYMGTFSKVMFPALRLAYVVLPSVEMVKEFDAFKETIDRRSPAMEQLMLCTFMEEGHFLRHIRKMRVLYAERLTILIGLLKEQLSEYLTPSDGQSGLHLLCWISDKVDIALLKQEIEKRKLFVSFPSEYTIEHSIPPAITLGFAAFTKYRLKMGVEKLKECFENSLLNH